MNPGMKTNWFTRELAAELTRFYNNYVNGKRPILLLNVPSQHGRSLNVIDLIAWLIGHRPNTKVIYTSFSDRLSVRANLRPKPSHFSQTICGS
jgi:hypothetical protein